jgi:hypothetical protein
MEHHRLLTLNDSNPARNPSSTAKTTVTRKPMPRSSLLGTRREPGEMDAGPNPPGDALPRSPDGTD